MGIGYKLRPPPNFIFLTCFVTFTIFASTNGNLLDVASISKSCYFNSYSLVLHLVLVVNKD